MKTQAKKKTCEKHLRPFTHVTDGEQEFYGCEKCEVEEQDAFEQYLIMAGRRMYGTLAA
jgi:hypothetical protein